MLTDSRVKVDELCPYCDNPLVSLPDDQYECLRVCGYKGRKIEYLTGKLGTKGPTQIAVTLCLYPESVSLEPTWKQYRLRAEIERTRTKTREGGIPVRIKEIWDDDNVCEAYYYRPGWKGQTNGLNLKRAFALAVSKALGIPPERILGLTHVMRRGPARHREDGEIERRKNGTTND